MHLLAALVVAAIAVVSACGDDAPPRLIVVRAPPEHLAVFDEFMRFTDYPYARVEPDVGAGPVPSAFTIRVTTTLASPAEHYVVVPDQRDAADRAWEVHGSDLLGAQYGLAHALENLGFRWPHPMRAAPPDHPQFDDAARFDLDVGHGPEQRERGLQLHTLHPIESYFALWEPGPTSELEARRIFDWLIKNRGNYVQWPALDDIMDPARHAAWREHTADLLAAGHARGLRLGLGVQLYGSANLQHAFDLYDDEDGDTPLADMLDERLPLVMDDLPFDAYSLSFGEFFGADPARFIADVNTWAQAVRDRSPLATVRATVHVGEDERVTYEGEDLIYYMLLKFADPRIVSDVHTVMFYGLYEDAGGAYRHDSFEEHRQYLLDQLRAGRIGSYLPETAYWIAFDNSVPLAMPVYVRNRWLDLDRLADDTEAEGLAPLQSHVLFSSGWEWGYWLHDVTALRASYHRPVNAASAIRQAAAPMLGAEGVAVLVALAELQARTLGEQRLVAHLAGRDLSMDAGRMLGIVSQPDRPSVDELVAPGAAQRTLADVTLPDLRALATATDDLEARVRAAALPVNRWTDELRDELAVTAARTRFVVARYEAILAFATGDPSAAAAARGRMEVARDQGAAAVARRHAGLHHDRPELLVGEGANATFYQYGYLRQAETLCFWERELVEVDNLLTGAGAPLPGCLF